MELGRLYVYGHCYAPKRWRYDQNRRVNRLYYIYGGRGGCRYQGREYRFEAGKVYFIPYHKDLILFSDENDPILHTYADFELIPPIVCDRVLSADPQNDPVFSAAVNVFCRNGEGGAVQKGKTAVLTESGALERLFTSAILYVIDRLVQIHEIPVIRDEVILSALTRIHNDIGQSLSVSELAANAYMNCDSFIRRFHRVLGTTPYAYIKQLRLRTASYLRESGMPLGEIASETGYADATSLLHALQEKNK
ncbi:MAG: helix-turn-helix domain-containing protein [Clostridia bacterium]|nr:helix-turn-helix domain-containing protein [Clostridia bacterium]